MKCEYTEICPHCENEITLLFDVKKEGYKATCPICGGRLMLCDACQHRGPDDKYIGDCDYCTATDSCRFNPPSAVERMRSSIREALSEKGLEILDGEDESFIIRDAEHDQDFLCTITENAC